MDESGEFKIDFKVSKSSKHIRLDVRSNEPITYEDLIEIIVSLSKQDNETPDSLN